MRVWQGRLSYLAILGPLVASLWPCCLSILISALSDEQTILIGLQQLGRTSASAVNSPAHCHMSGDSADSWTPGHRIIRISHLH